MSRGASAKIRGRIGALQKRADHLASRIANDTRDLSWDKQELGALLWALDILRPMFVAELARDDESAA